jgi:DegT/DnrJ/EryC1/StrS aminotransferase family protein
MTADLPILPVDACTPALEDEMRAAARGEPFGAEARHGYGGASGRLLLAAWLSSLELQRDDEIAIVTTTDQTYVSTCLSITAFNVCRLSRVVTEATRAVIAVHEYGYVADDFAARVAQWRRREVAVLEDCAHLAGLQLPWGVVGALGDAALFSLPKLAPVAQGGWLRTVQPLPSRALSRLDPSASRQAALDVERYLPHCGWLNERRRRRAALLNDMPPAGFRAVLPALHAVPWMVVLDGPAAEVRHRVHTVEWGATLDPNWLLVPTNPFVDEGVFATVREQSSAMEAGR